MTKSFKSFGLIAAIALLCASVAIVGCGGSSSGGGAAGGVLTTRMPAGAGGASMRGALRGATPQVIIQAYLTLAGMPTAEKRSAVLRGGFYEAQFNIPISDKERAYKVEFKRFFPATKKEVAVYRAYGKAKITKAQPTKKVEADAKTTAIAEVAEKKFGTTNIAHLAESTADIKDKADKDTTYAKDIKTIEDAIKEVADVALNKTKTEDDVKKAEDKNETDKETAVNKAAAQAPETPKPADTDQQDEPEQNQNEQAPAGSLKIINKSGIDLNNCKLNFANVHIPDSVLTFSVKNNQSITVTAENVTWTSKWDNGDTFDYKTLGTPDIMQAHDCSFNDNGVEFQCIILPGTQVVPDFAEDGSDSSFWLHIKDGKFTVQRIPSHDTTTELQLTLVKFVNGTLTIKNNRASDLTNFPMELQQGGSTVGTIMLSLAKGAKKKVAPSEVQWKDGFDYNTFNGALSIKGYIAAGEKYFIYLNNKEFGSYVMSDDDVAGNKKRQFFPNVELSLIADGITSPSPSLQFQNNYSEDITDLKIDLCRAAANGSATDESVGTITLTLPKGEAVNVSPSFVEFKAGVHYEDFDISGQTGAEELSRRLYFGALSDGKIDRAGLNCLVIEQHSFGNHVDDGPLVSEIQILKKKE